MEDELISDLQEIITDISNFGEMNQLQIDQYCEEILTLIRKREMLARIDTLVKHTGFTPEYAEEKIKQQLKDVER